MSLPDLLSAADVVSLHVPLTAETAGMIDERAIQKMKRGAVLVNTARGGLVDYDALHRALTTGRLRGAGLDVFDAEPASAAHPLFKLPNVVVTPHVAWFTAETLQQKSWRVCRELQAASRWRAVSQSRGVGSTFQFQFQFQFRFGSGSECEPGTRSRNRNLELGTASYQISFAPSWMIRGSAADVTSPKPLRAERAPGRIPVRRVQHVEELAAELKPHSARI